MFFEKILLFFWGNDGKARMISPLLRMKTVLDGFCFAINKAKRRYVVNHRFAFSLRYHPFGTILRESAAAVKIKQSGINIFLSNHRIS